jgi:DNA helicase II / ATP-dependent DNA helicase PcrA
MSPADLIRHLLDLIGYEEHLRKTQSDFDSRWENVDELINFATQANDAADIGAVSTDLDIKEAEQDALDVDWQDSSLYEDLDRDGLVEIIPRKADTVAAGKPSPKSMEYVDLFSTACTLTGSTRTTPLRTFLQASMLSTDSETQDDQAAQEVRLISFVYLNVTVMHLCRKLLSLPATQQRG